MAETPDVVIRPVAAVEEYRACQDVQRRAWGITEDGYVVPVATMISVQHAGGLVLGAFRGERLIGFAFGYLGRVRGKWALYSQLAGVDPVVQAAGVGRQLKLAQRAWAREQGLALVAWSYDPLQAGNANFNLHVLGAFSRTYEVNYFGERSDQLNAGLDTDRLLVEWPVEEHPFSFEGGGQPLALFGRTKITSEVSSPVASSRPLPADGSALEVDIPASLSAVKAHDPNLARAWQEVVREAFGRAFAAGYWAVNFSREQDDRGPRAYYVLRRPRPVWRDEP